MHRDYGYTQEWVDLLIEKMKDAAEFAALYKLDKHEPQSLSSNSAATTRLSETNKQVGFHLSKACFDVRFSR
jgi:hypothetical protein